MTEETRPLLDLVMEYKSSPVENPMEMDAVTVTIHLICLVAGSVASVYTTVVVARDCTWSPRIVILSATLVSNLGTFLVAVMELCYHFYPNESVCKFYIAVAGLPYAIFLLCSLFASVDKYFAVSDPLWHRGLSGRVVVYIINFAVVVLAVLIKWIYVAQWVPLRCEIRIIHIQILGAMLLVLLLSNLCAQIVVYLKFKWGIHHQSMERSGSSGSSSGQSASSGSGSTGIFTISNEHSDSATKQGGAVCVPIGKAVESGSMSVHVPQSRRNQLQAEATKTLLLSVAPLIILTFSLIFYLIIYSACTWMHSVEEWCAIARMKMYFNELPLFHPTYHIVVYAVRMRRK